MKAITIVFVMCLIASPSLGFTLQKVEPPKVQDMSSISSDVFKEIRGGEDLKPFGFTWSNPKFFNASASDKKNQKDYYLETDSSYSYLNSWGDIAPAKPKQKY